MRKLRVGGLGLIAGLVLASCGGSPTSPALLGNPSLNISVPLNVAGCDDAGTCFAIGTTGLDIAPNAAAQQSTHNKPWRAVTTPNAPSTLMDAVGCWHSGCLFGGSNTSGDVLWRTTSNSAMVATAAPSAGRGVSALSCFAGAHCAAVDSDRNGQTRVSFTDNHGESWTSPTPITWNANATALSVACTSDANCVVAGTTRVNGGSAAIWSVTNDAGATWTTSRNASWIQLIDLTCNATQCVALASQPNGLGVIMHSRNGGVRWTRDATQPGKSPGTLACSRALHCLSASATSPSIALESAGKWTARRLKYVPDPFIAAGCGTTYCVAVGSQTTLIVKQ